MHEASLRTDQIVIIQPVPCRQYREHAQSEEAHMFIIGTQAIVLAKSPLRNHVT